MNTETASNSFFKFIRLNERERSNAYITIFLVLLIYYNHQNNAAIEEIHKRELQDRDKQIEKLEKKNDKNDDEKIRLYQELERLYKIPTAKFDTIIKQNEKILKRWKRYF